MNIINKSKMNVGNLENLVQDLYEFSKDRLLFTKEPKVLFVDDEKNANDIFGKTAFYDPVNMSITVYTTGRHIKDILRSISHELVHHSQNCKGQFSSMDNAGEGYAQKNPLLRKMEKDAYLNGNMNFRDFEDTLKTNNKQRLNETVEPHKDILPRS